MEVQVLENLRRNLLATILVHCQMRVALGFEGSCLRIENSIGQIGNQIRCLLLEEASEPSHNAGEVTDDPHGLAVNLVLMVSQLEVLRIDKRDLLDVLGEDRLVDELFHCLF